MARRKPRKTARGQGLRQAAATLFCLLAVLPLLVFVWTLYRLDAIHDAEAQIGLGLSLAVAILGFVVLRRLMGQISELMQAMALTAGQTAPSSTTAPATAPAGSPPAANPAAAGPSAASPPAAGKAPTPGPASRAAAPQRAARAGGPLGAIQELDDMRAAVSTMWRREAETRIGQDIAVSVMNARDPVIGTLVQVTDDGLLLEQDGERVGVVWRRIAGVEGVRTTSAR